MFLHPRQVTQVMSQLSGVAAYRFLIDRVDHRDVLRCEVVRDRSFGDTPDPALARGDDLVPVVRQAVRSGLRFDADVVVVPALEGDPPPITDLRTWE
jgi:phenylacetate-CoA ligase